MRFSEEKIKETILHSDPKLRDRATRYFSKSYTLDTSIMPLVIQAVETYDKNDAYHLIGASRDLPQTEDTIAWVMEQLNDEKSDQYENYTYNLSMILMKAAPNLLLLKESAILGTRHFLSELHEAFKERLRMVSWDFDTCWRKLEALCEEGKDIQYVNKFNWGHGTRIVEALARYGQECEEKVTALLSEKIEDYSHSPMKWMEPLTVRLVGEARLDSSIPLVVAKLHEDADLLNEECTEALTKIGTPAVVEAIAGEFPQADFHFRLYSSSVLEHIHSDLVVRKCLALIQDKKEWVVRRELAHALLSHFAKEGIAITRQLLLNRKSLDYEDRHLRNYLVETCTFMDERFPEYEKWLATEKKEKEEHHKRVEELKDDPKGLLLFALEKLAGKKAEDVTKTKPTISKPPRKPAARLLPRQKPKSKKKVGRNSPCHCGSGKKFKNCCMVK